VTYQPQWSPPPGDWNYPPVSPAPPPTPPEAPKQPGIAWLWAVIVILIVVAAVRLGMTPAPTVPPTVPNLPQATTAVPEQPSPTAPATDIPSGGFCTTYYVFSINVTASRDNFTAAVSQGDATTAAALAGQFYSQAQAMQKAPPPSDLGAQVDTVTTDFQTVTNALSSGSVADVPSVDDIWADVAALQSVAGSVCG